MNFFDKLTGRLTAPRLTRGRIAAAMTIAFVADLLQIALMPVAWTFSQSAVDVVAMVLMIWVIGFHLLLLPTFLIEFVPGVDMLPTWTACVIAVIVLRKREQGGKMSPAQDVASTVEATPPPQLPLTTSSPPSPDRD